MYNIRYLSIAQRDLWDITAYILEDLKSPKDAMDFIDVLDKSILRLRQYPYSCRLYYPQEPLETECRFLPVKNYLVFFTVTENIVEIHRIIYARMNLDNLGK